MAIPLQKTDFEKGGKFYNLDLPTKLPLPRSLLNSIYSDKFPKCDKFISKSSQLGLLKYMWHLKDVEVEWCLCQQNHLLPITLHHKIKRQLKFSKLTKKDFIISEDIDKVLQKGKYHGKLDMNCITAELPLPDYITEPMFNCIRNFYDAIPEGECFKSPKYQIKVLKKMYDYVGRPSKICVCSLGTHLTFLNC